MKMSKKILASVIALMLIANVSYSFAVTSYAKGSSPSTSSRSGSFSSKGSNFQNTPTGGNSGKVTSPSGSNGFSGGSSNKSTVPNVSSSGYQRPTNVADGSGVNPNSGRSYYGGSTYSNSPPSGYHISSFWPVAGAFAAGSMLGSMIHPWGGYYASEGGGYVHQSFSFLTTIMDIVIFLIVIWLIVTVIRLLTRRRSY
jgi:hypothetical protein